MGILRTSFAWLIASLTVGIVTALPHVTLANDAGPGKEVRAIRRTLPVLVADEMFKTPSPAVVVDAVAVDGNTALAQWHDDAGTRIALLSRRYDRWWLSDGYALNVCGVPLSSSALSNNGFSPSLVEAAAQALPAVKSADASTTPLPQTSGDYKLVRSTPVLPKCSQRDVSSFYFTSNVQLLLQESSWGNYGFRATFTNNTAGPFSHLVDISYRAPTEAESWITNGGNSYFYFSGTLLSIAPVHFEPGTTIDVWFPFVLDTQLQYGLTLAHADKPIGPIDGTLDHNVVHFVLPAFTLQPGAHLMGEIEGDAWPHSSY